MKQTFNSAPAGSRHIPLAGLILIAAAPATAHAVTLVQDQPAPVVVMETNLGNIHIQLMPDQAPRTVAHFLSLVDRGFYSELLFHRVVRDFVVQTGLMNMDGELVGDAVDSVENEADNRVRNLRGTVALARLEDPHSAKGEFFINVRDNRDLDFKSYRRDEWGYAVFGRVIEGMDVVEQISRRPTRRAGILREFPREPVVIYSAYRLR